MISTTSLLPSWFIYLEKICGCVDDAFLFPNESHDNHCRDSEKKSTILHKERFICRSIRFISYFSFNYSCFEQIELLPNISWYWKFYVPIWALPNLAPTCFPEVICPRHDSAYTSTGDGKTQIAVVLWKLS